MAENLKKSATFYFFSAHFSLKSATFSFFPATLEKKSATFKSKMAGKFKKSADFEEFMAILKYTVSLTILLGFTVFIIRQGAAFSRLVFGVFAVFDAIFTYIAHNAFKKYLYYYYSMKLVKSKYVL